MIEGLQPYSQMRITGQPWLPSIPSHWDVRRNGRLFSERRETGYPDLPILEVSLRSGVRIRDMEGGKRKQQIADRSAYQRAVKGDVAYNMMRMWQGAVGVAPADGLVSPAYVVATAHDGVDPAYYAYLFRTEDYMKEIDSYSRGIVPDRNRLYWQAFKQMPSAYPPLDEQRLIVRFLDWHSAMSAKLIRAKRQLIALLNEQKQSIIHRAITRGLDPAARLKPSGVDWLGDVPEHWDVAPLKRLVKMQSGETITAAAIDDTGPFPVYGGNGLRGYTSRSTNSGEFILIGRQGALCGNVHLVDGDFFASEHAIVCHPRAAFDALWLAAVMEVMNLNQYSIAAAQPGLSVDRIAGLKVPIPSPDEQRTLTATISQETRETNEAIALTQREIALIQEFRTRLIDDVVTGQLDVRSIAASLPDVVEIEAADNLTDENDLDDADVLIEEDEAA